MAVNLENEQEVEELIDIGKKLLEEKDHENAIQAFGTAMQMQVKKYGDLDPKSARAYFLYGKALVDSYRENVGIFSEKIEADNFEIPYHLKTDENLTSESQQEEPDEESTDLEVAWENLDAARIILDKCHDSFNKSILADVLIYLGIIEFESGREENSCMELKSALDILENFKNTDHQHYAHAAYELALVYNMRSMYVDAQRYYAMARDVLDIHITKLKENFIENRQKIDEISIILLQLDDKIEDCRSCIEDSPRINQEKEPKSPTKMTKTDSDITHLVKRKIPETDENNQGKKSN